MAMDRPKDFRLEIKFHGRSQADIGSNDQGFWFWVNDKKEKAIYVCDYEHANANPLGVTMQPEWIMEAMGLREISEREAATISATKGDKPGQLVLTQLRNDPKGGTLTKVTVVDESSGEILEHRLYSGAKEKLLARATISETKHIQMESTEADPSGSVVNFPAKIKLEWVAEKFSLDITMDKPTINPVFPKNQQVALFTEPKIRGAVRTDLAKLGPPPASASSRIYESAPRQGRASGWVGPRWNRSASKGRWDRPESFSRSRPTSRTPRPSRRPTSGPRSLEGMTRRSRPHRAREAGDVPSMTANSDR